jgi:hypothetical protein
MENLFRVSIIYKMEEYDEVFTLVFEGNDPEDVWGKLKAFVSEKVANATLNWQGRVFITGAGDFGFGCWHVKIDKLKVIDMPSDISIDDTKQNERSVSILLPEDRIIQATEKLTYLDYE